VRTAPDTLLSSVIGERADVATYHHQAVDELPSDVVASAWAEDGTVEAFEVCDSSWALGVQWHPEVDDGTSLFAAFVAACRSRIT
jgi:putative glutamine amidotransferase